jgi:hypothetical protein
VSDVFRCLDASRESVRKTEYRTTMSFIDLKERRRVASSCPFKQKFICVSIWQSALDSVGIASYLYYRQTAKGYGLPLKTFLKNRQHFQTTTSNLAVAGSESRENKPSGLANPVQTMALDAFRSQTVDDKFIDN